MNKEQAYELIVEYEDIILEFSRKTEWLLKTAHGRPYKFAVHNSIHDKIIDKLELIHKKLLKYSGIKA